MFVRNRSFVGKAVLALSVLLLAADRAMAYVGPGADVAFLSHAAALLAWVLAAFSALLPWPIYALLRKFRGRRSRAELGNQEKSTVCHPPPTLIGENDEIAEQRRSRR